MPWLNYLTAAETRAEILQKVVGDRRHDSSFLGSEAGEIGKWILQAEQSFRNGTGSKIFSGAPETDFCRVVWKQLN